MFTTFENLKETAKKVAKKVGTTCYVHGQQISFHRDNNSPAYLGIAYSPDRHAAYNTFSSQGETAITNGDQLERMLRQDVNYCKLRYRL